MKDFFSRDSNLYPFRWFIIIAALLTMGMTYLDYTGYRMLTFASSTGRTYYGGPSGHK